MIKAKLGMADTRDGVLDLLRNASNEFGQSQMEVQWPGGSPVKVAIPCQDSTGNGATTRKDRYEFDDTGMIVEVASCSESATEELVMEQRVLFEEICKAANRRLASLRVAEGRRERQSEAGRVSGVLCDGSVPLPLNMSHLAAPGKRVRAVTADSTNQTGRHARCQSGSHPALFSR
jgi:hypothetical protein